MLSALVLWFLLTLTFLLVLAAAATVAFSWQLKKANRVSPDVETLAPTLWLWAPTQPARMHRRLRAAVAPIHDNVPRPVKKRRLTRPPEQPNPTPTAELSRTLVDQAVTLDQHVVAASRLARPQRRMQLRAIDPQVIEVERLSARILHHQRRLEAEAAIPGAPPRTPPVVLADLAHQLDLLDSAHQELQAIEQANGLLDPERVMRAAAPPSHAPAFAPDQPPPPQGPPVRTTQLPPPQGPPVRAPHLPPPGAARPAPSPAPAPAPAPGQRPSPG